MSLAAPGMSDVTLGEVIRLEEVVERPALAELVQTTFELHRIPIKILDVDGSLLAASDEESALYTYLEEFASIRGKIAERIRELRRLELSHDGEADARGITGAIYRVVDIRYDGRAIGRMIIGPYVEPGFTDVDSALYALEPRLDRERVKSLASSLPASEPARVAAISAHLSRTLDLILFSGHKALLTGNMHLAAMRESYRELSDKTAKLQVAFDRLKELDRLKSNFLATVSHELRTPLTSIIGYSEMLGEGIAGELSEEQQEFVQTIRDKSEQLLELIKGLLDLSKLESGTMSLRKADIGISSVIEDVAETLTPTAKKKKVTLGVWLEPDLPSLWADKERLRQVFLNLTENAIKFTPPGGSVFIAARLTTIETQLGDDAIGLVLMTARRTAVEVRVVDSGIGIPVIERERVFDAFYQVDSSSTREQGGTGLGLSIVKRLVEAHDGLVRIEDNEPQGTVFVVTIPCRRASML